MSYSRDGGFAVLRRHVRLAGVLAADSTAGAVLGGLLLGVVPARPGLRGEGLKPPQTDGVEPVA